LKLEPVSTGFGLLALEFIPGRGESIWDLIRHTSISKYLITPDRPKPTKN
jgi:hypothetical protein